MIYIFFRSLIIKIYHSIWLFPLVLTLILIYLTVLEISGSSIGVYHQFFYRNTNDPNLILGEPRPIRSDEWLVNSQAIIAQSQENFPNINNNIGNGQDMSLIIDAPYRDWSIIFKPHNLAFFAMPLENAFAFRWWFMGYLLILGCYFFTLAILPGRRLIAAGLASALFFSGFVQWWYTYGTLGSLFLSFFIAITVINLIEKKNFMTRVLLGTLLAYLIVVFALILYPSFQIPSALVTIFFLFSYLATRWREIGSRSAFTALGVSFVSLLIALGVVGAYFYTRLDVIEIINNTVYPGTIIHKSGWFFPFHFLTSHLGGQFVDGFQANQYLVNGIDRFNESESSNFLLLIPFLIIPSLALFFRKNTSNISMSRDWPLLAVIVIFIVFMLHQFLPSFGYISKYFFLDRVGVPRVLIGIGLINIFLIVLLIRHMINREIIFSRQLVIFYTLMVFLFQVMVAQVIVNYPGDFVTTKEAILLSIPLTLVVMLLLLKRFEFAIIIYFLFSFYIGSSVNPLYKGLDIVTNNQLSQAIQKTEDSGRFWVTDNGMFFNFPSMNGKRTLSGIHNYPQFEIWDQIEGAHRDIYNRYAHVVFRFSNDPNQKTELNLLQTDSFVAIIYPCSSDMNKLNIGYIVSKTIIDAPCLKIIQTVSKPGMTVYIYKVDQNYF